MCIREKMSGRKDARCCHALEQHDDDDDDIRLLSSLLFDHPAQQIGRLITGRLW